jgi:hypothetical protein
VLLHRLHPVHLIAFLKPNAGGTIRRYDRTSAVGRLSALPWVDRRSLATPVSRSDPVLRFVRSRQRFVHRCHGRKKAPAIHDRGKLSKRLKLGPPRSACWEKGEKPFFPGIVGPNPSLSLCPRPRTCSCTPNICLSKPRSRRLASCPREVPSRVRGAKKAIFLCGHRCYGLGGHIKAAT